MKQPIIASSTLLPGQLSVHEIYNRYAGLLLGYITEVVKDRHLAETYLVEVFKQVANFGVELTGAEANTWLKLRQMAKNISNAHSQQPANMLLEIKNTPEFNNKFLTLMNAEQQHVFCGVYYRQKSLAALALELNHEEHRVKQVLKEAFGVIRNGE